MTIGWYVYRIICVLQTIMAAYLSVSSLIYSFTSFSFANIVSLLTYVLVMLLAIMAVNILNTNYPDIPVQGSQKTTFNRLFLLNFIFLTFQFGFIISEYRELKDVAALLHLGFIELPFSLLLILITYMVILIFQLIILYGLYELRRLLYSNFMKKKFEFEEGGR